MLFAQIPRSIFQKIASALSINLKFFIMEIGATVKGNQSEEMPYSKLQTTVKHIEKHFDIGTVDDPKAFFRGTLSMQWGPIADSNIVYFSGSTSSTIVGLGGSLNHVIGGTDTSSVQQVPIVERVTLGSQGSSLPNILDALNREHTLIKQINSYEPLRKADQVLETVEAMHTYMQGPQQTFEFLARKLVESKQDMKEKQPSHRIILGTPIYIALAD